MTVCPEHKVVSETVMESFGMGLTVTTYKRVSPGHGKVLLASDAVTKNVTCWGALVVLVRIMAGKVDPPDVGLMPETPAGIGVETAQDMVEPGVGEVNVTALVVSPEHIACGAGNVTPGAGFTVTVNVVGVPGHPFATGVTV